MTPHGGTTFLFHSSQQLPRLRLEPLKGACQLKKPFKGTRWRQGSCWENRIEQCFPDEGHWFALQANQWFFTNRKQKKIELVARPGIDSHRGHCRAVNNGVLANIHCRRKRTLRKLHRFVLFGKKKVLLNQLNFKIYVSHGDFSQNFFAN